MFNPVKDDSKEGVKARRMIWSTEAIQSALEGLRQGKRLVANPFYENNTKLLKSDLNFERTPEELEEYKKCMSDVLYFADQCQLMTPEGIQHVQFRDYQKKYLKHIQDNRLSIYLACRQCGKCVCLDTFVQVRIDWRNLNIKKRYRKAAFELFELEYKIGYNEYSVPLYELVNLYDHRLSWKLKYAIWKRDISTHVKYSIIGFLDFMFEDIGKSDELQDKFVRQYDCCGINAYTDTGYHNVPHIYITIPFIVYNLRLNNGMQLNCADNHIVFTMPSMIGQHHNSIVERYACSLHKSDIIVVDNDKKSSSVCYNKMTDDFLCMCDLTIDSTDHRYYTNGILSHNTTTSAIFLLWYVLFNVDKNALVIGSKRRVAVEILDKVKKIFYELPYYLKPGVLKWNEGEVVFDNGCRILAEATTINSGISYTFHCVLADEFAHVSPNILDKFYNNLFPTITAGKARFMITSTQNGRNLFYRLYKAAEAGENDYAPFKTDWYEVPEWSPEEGKWVPRDEAWHKRQVANYGSEEAFNAQFGTNFDISTNTLISQKKLRSLDHIKFESKPLWGVSDSDKWYWDPSIDPMTDLRRPLIITCDLSEQIGQDYTVFLIWKITSSSDQPKLPPQGDKIIRTLIGYYRTNSTDRDVSAQSLLEFITNYTNQERLLVSNERNTYGEIFIKSLLTLADDKFNSFDPSVLCKYYNETGSSWKYGCRITPGNKSIHCSLFKEEYEKGLIINNEERSTYELENFIDDGSGHYAASFGHDDMVMASVQLAYVEEILQYKILTENLNDYTPLNDWNPYDAISAAIKNEQLFEHQNDMSANRRRLLGAG